MGILLAINQMRTERKFEDRFERLDTLAEVVDLTHSTDVNELRQLIEAYMRVNEPELGALKSTTVTSALDSLLRLAREKSSGELERTEYYRWLLPMLEAAPSGSEIRALSLMLDVEWDESELERRFIDQNRRAAERGVVIDRVFVMRRGDLAEALSRPEIRSHTSEEKPENLRGHFVDLEKLEETDRALSERLSATITNPSQRYPAQFGFVQIATPQRTVTLPDGTVRPSTANGVPLCDTTDLFNPFYCGGMWQLAPGERKTESMTDVPWMATNGPFGAVNAVTVNRESFATYLMFQCTDATAPGSLFVPVAQWTWRWGVQAIRVPGGFTINNPQRGGEVAQAPAWPNWPQWGSSVRNYADWGGWDISSDRRPRA